ncbi:rhodanese [Enterococcus florum]|uniref:Rhodanese n=1 Tax=Enterococcus florum TaxID=2480627 RepID=A0A4P5PC33_9ENTE|nr:rhodanese-like domain-containing protein [Enterococcus florum]GCF95336.1 rhodanese [Enterococcus florum]
MLSFFKRSPEISISELKALLKGNIPFIDVRSLDEYALGHIKGAKNVPLEQIDSFNGKKEAAVYVICRSGIRSKQAAAYLTKAGYQAVHVRGGMNRWDEKRKGGYEK